MFEAIMIWLYLSVGNFVGVIVPIVLFAGFIYLIALLLYGLSSEWGLKESSYYTNEVAAYKSLRTKFKPVVSFMMLFIAIATLYPSKDDLKWIIGGALVWNGAQSVSEIEGIGDLPKNTVDAMNHFLKSLQEEDPVVETKGE